MKFPAHSLKSIKLQNILSFGPEGMELELRPLNVLIGANASGKSNLLDVVDLLRSLPRIYKGTHLTHPKVMMKQAKEIEIQSAYPLNLQADGELLGELPARFRVLPSALNVIV